MHRYGIGADDFDELVEQQGGGCAICGRENPEHVDHDHETGEVRGVLCFSCNGGLGQFRDSIDAAANAVAYLDARRSGRCASSTTLAVERAGDCGECPYRLARVIESPMPSFGPGAGSRAVLRGPAAQSRAPRPPRRGSSGGGRGAAPIDIVHGTTVLAIRYDGGVVMAGDRRATAGYIDRQPAHREGVRRPTTSPASPSPAPPGRRSSW